MDKLKFTKRNFYNLVRQENISLEKLRQIFLNDTEKFFEALAETIEIIKLNLDVLDYIPLDDWLFSAVEENAFSEDYFVYDNTEEVAEEDTYIKFKNDFLDLDPLDGHQKVVENLFLMVENIKNKDEADANDFIKTLQTSANNIPIEGGNICSPKKYLAYSPFNLPKGYTVLELRPNSDSSAKFRCYGYLIKNIIYLLNTYIKNSGQDKADKDFDNFMQRANKIISEEKLTENLLYNNYRGDTFMEDINAIKILENLQKQDYYRDYNAGWNHYFSGNFLNENTVSDAYLDGYYSAEKSKKDLAVREYIKDHHNEILSAFREWKKENNK